MTPSATPAEAPPGGVTARTALILLLLVTLLRLAVAARMPLSPDEAYYWVWSKALAPGYLDHPPMVALWIWLGTHLAGDSALGVRVLGPISAFAGSLLLVQAGRDLAPGGQAGERAAWMLNATLVLNAGAVIMTPDTPLLFFWSAALAAAARLQRSANPAWFLAIGVAAGLGLDSKYTAMLLAPVLLVWLLLAPSRRAWLRCWQLYAGAVLAAVLFAPVVLWNAAHGFASFAKQGGRGAAFTPSHAPRFLARVAQWPDRSGQPPCCSSFFPSGYGTARGAGGRRGRRWLPASCWCRRRCSRHTRWVTGSRQIGRPFCIRVPPWPPGWPGRAGSDWVSSPAPRSRPSCCCKPPRHRCPCRENWILP